MFERIRDFWRRFLFWIGVTAFCAGLCALSGCAQAHPQKVVHALDWQESRHMLQTAASGQADARPIKEQLLLPQRVQTSLNSDDGFIQIKVDAPVIVPDIAAAPVAQVAPRAFSQAEVSRFFDALCGDAVLYSNAEADMSKPEIESEIAFVQRCIADDEDANRPARLAHRKGYLKALQAQYASAPDTVEEKRVPDGIMTVQQDINFGTMEAYGSHEAVVSGNGDLSFVAMNNIDQTQLGVVDYGENGEIVSAYGALSSARISFHALSRYPEGYTGLYDNRYLCIADETVTPEEARGKLAATPRDARLAAEALLSGTGMEVQEIHLVLCNESGSSEDAPADFGYLYGVFCTQSVNGAPCNAMDMDAPDPWKYKGGGGAFMPQWPYERCLVLYGDGGIASFEWEAPMEVAEIVTAHAKLLPFADIMDVFTHMAPIVMAGYTEYRYGINRYEVTVDRIQFGLHRVTEAADVVEGMLVPVWTFYGSQTAFADDGSADDVNAYMMPKIILSVNAINGNVIRSDMGK